MFLRLFYAEHQITTSPFLICVISWISLGFDVRIKGDHFIYTQKSVIYIINIQPIGNKAKAYQVKQVRNIILKYKLAR
jgi:hypothetical protein